MNAAFLEVLPLVLVAMLQTAPTKGPLSPEEAYSLRQDVLRWVECEECTDGELKAVLKWGPAVVPTLTATLKEGPSPARREELEQHLRGTYRDLKAYERTHAEARVGLSEEDYLKTYRENFLALYTTRSARALAAVGGPAARRAL